MVSKRILRGGLGAICGALLVLIALECILRLLPVNTGVKLLPVSERNPIQRGIPRSTFTYSQGWDFSNARTVALNNYGFSDSIDYVPDSQAIVVIGDSFIEGQMISPGHTLAGQLRSEESSFGAAYGLGASGAGLSDYVASARFAANEFQASALIVLIVSGDIKESLLPKKGGYHFQREPDGSFRLTRVDSGPGGRLWNNLVKSKLFLYLVQNLKFRPSKIFDAVLGRSGKNMAESTTDFSDVVETFLTLLPIESRLPPQRIVLVFDPDREVLFNALQKASRINSEDAIRPKFVQSAIDRGYVVVDLSSAFREDYRLTHVRPDFAPFDMHWNSRGHMLAAREIAQTLTLRWRTAEVTKHSGGATKNATSDISSTEAAR
jgi:hypothetical protein